MKWFESIKDLGDGSNRTLRFKTREDAKQWLQNTEYEEFGCYPLGDLEEVDTDSPYFWD